MGEDLNTAYERYAELIRRHAYRIVQDHDAAEDILQEVLIRMWRNNDQLQQVQNRTAWLVRVTVNLSLNHLRTKKRRREEPLVYPSTEDGDSDVIDRAFADSSPGPDEMFERDTEKRLVRELIQDLPQEKREVMELIHQRDYSVGETAEKLGVPDGTVKSRLHYGRQTLATRLRAILRDT